MHIGRNSVVLAALALAGARAGRAQDVPLSAGHYDVIVSGMPGGNTESRPRCITPEHLKYPEAIFTYAFARKATPLPSVKVMKFSATGGRISYEAETPTSITRVEGTISSTGFAVQRTTTPKNGKGAPITMKLEGKRTGGCQ